MTFSNASGIGVNNFYGARDTSGTIGLEHGEDSLHRVNISFTPEMLNGSYLPPVTIPKGALFRSATLRVDEAFTMTGTTPTVIFGAAGAEAANGFALTAAELAAVGTKVPASAGAGQFSTTSATGVAAAVKLGKALGGTTPAVTGTAGKATLTLTYYNKTKV